jgi:hypothetical protein
MSLRKEFGPLQSPDGRGGSDNEVALHLFAETYLRAAMRVIAGSGDVQERISEKAEDAEAHITKRNRNIFLMALQIMSDSLRAGNNINPEHRPDRTGISTYTLKKNNGQREICIVTRLSNARKMLKNSEPDNGLDPEISNPVKHPFIMSFVFNENCLQDGRMPASFSIAFRTDNQIYVLRALFNFGSIMGDNDAGAISIGSIAHRSGQKRRPRIPNRVIALIDGLEANEYGEPSTSSNITLKDGRVVRVEEFVNMLLAEHYEYTDPLDMVGKESGFVLYGGGVVRDQNTLQQIGSWLQPKNDSEVPPPWIAINTIVTSASQHEHVKVSKRIRVIPIEPVGIDQDEHVMHLQTVLQDLIYYLNIDDYTQYDE